jgi:hypothetical protein
MIHDLEIVWKEMVVGSSKYYPKIWKDSGKPQKISFRSVDIPANIRTKHLDLPSQSRCGYSKALRAVTAATEVTIITNPLAVKNVQC